MKPCWRCGTVLYEYKRVDSGGHSSDGIRREMGVVSGALKSGCLSHECVLGEDHVSNFRRCWYKGCVDLGRGQ
jgi:hypothetical protein